jgi:signal transduction histidine kinase
MKIIDTLKKVFHESINLKSYWKFKLFWGIILFCTILFTFDKYYDDARIRGINVTSVVTGLEYLKQEKQDEALQMSLNDAKGEIIKWIKEFKVFEVIPHGCYDVVLYTSANSKDKTVLYTLYLHDGEISEVKEKKITNVFNTGCIEFRQGFISITYSLNDYFEHVLLPTIVFEVFIMVLIIIFILKDKEKIQSITEAQEAQRFRSLVHITSGIAHNFRNDLSVIYGQLRLLKKESMSKPPERKYTRQTVINRIEIIEPVITGMKESIDKILNFTKEDIKEKEDIDIIDTLRCSVEMFDQTIGEGIEVTFNTDYKGILCKGKRQMYNTVFLNILNNSQQALDKSKDKKIDVCVDIEDESVIIRFIDSGCGMSEETRMMAFVPFYTVNKTRGTGLGLSTSRSTIEQFGGKIEIESTIIDKGTIIKIELPIISL